MSGHETPSPEAAHDRDPGVGGDATPGPEPAPVEWTWSPWRERPGSAAIALGFTLFACALVALLTSSTPLVVVMTLAIAVTLAPLLVPSRCRIDEDGVALQRAFGWERRAWSELKRARSGRDALVVSPFSTPRRLDAFRALVLPIPGRGRDTLLAGVRTHCERHHLGTDSATGTHGA